MVDVEIGSVVDPDRGQSRIIDDKSGLMFDLLDQKVA